ncbi:MAG: hypothetical protein LBG52_08260 [Candidatus Peribacteria bacterium]|jgi:hypothetical protein|nr:hypothetical protein [Candidatus Peribacteria bacterium]
MSSNLQSPESKNQSPYLPTNEVKTREEFLQKIGNRKPNTRKMTLHGEYVEIELDTSNTFSIKRETLQQITKEINKEMDVENLQDLNKLMSTLEKKSAYSATKSELNALQVEPYIANRLEKQPFTTLEGFITALTELENDFHLKKQFVKQNFGQRLIDPFQKDDTKQRMQKETTEKLDAWISYLHNFRKEKAEERKKTAKYNKKAAKKGNAEITPEISQTDLDNFMDAFHQRDLLSTDVKNFQAGNLTPKAGFPINSKKYVKRSISESRKYYEMQKDLNKIKNDAAVLKIFGNSAEEAERYFDAVINGQMSPQMDQYYQQVADHF